MNPQRILSRYLDAVHAPLQAGVSHRQNGRFNLLTGRHPDTYGAEVVYIDAEEGQGSGPEWVAATGVDAIIAYDRSLEDPVLPGRPDILFD